MKQEYVLAFDVGTSSVKAVVVDLSGALCATATAPLQLLSPQRDWKEQDPDELWRCVCACSSTAVLQAALPLSGLRGVVFGTYWKGIFPVDADGNSLCPAILWLDGRAQAQADALNEKLGTDFMGAIEYWPKLLWFREQLPEAYEKTAQILDANAYLKYRATGEYSSDYNNNFILSADTKLQARYDRVLQAAQLDKAKFPPLVRSTQQVGHVTERAAMQMGIRAGVPVFGGTTDLASIAIGSGCSAPGQGHLYLGSSGWLGAALPSDPTGQRPPCLPFYDGMELALAGMQSAGMSFDWGARCFYNAGVTLAPAIYQTIAEEVGKIPAGSSDLLCIPWIHGEKAPHDPNARCTFFGAEAGHNRAHFLGAIMEGIAFQLRQSMELLQSVGMPPFPELRAVGGCTGSTTWMQRTADILGTPIHVPAYAQHAGAVGTAYCALVGLGICRDFTQAREMIQVQKIYEPQTQHSAHYARLFAVWQQLEPALTGCSALLKQNAGGVA